MKLTHMICMAAALCLSACTTAAPNVGPPPIESTVAKVHDAICDNRDTVREQALHAIDYANTHIANAGTRNAAIAVARTTLALLAVCPPRVEPPG